MQIQLTLWPGHWILIETLYPWTKAEEQNARKVAVSRNILNSMLKRDLLLMRRVYL